MSNKIHYHYRITKYNPAFRDENGIYTLHEWISPWDVGKSFNGKRFTLKDYHLMEEAYIDTVLHFMKESHLSSLQLFHYKKNHDLFQKESPLFFEKAFNNISLEEGMFILIEDIPLICKMILRGYIHGQLVSKCSFYIHFGSDYYMYVGLTQPCEHAVQFARSNNLFVEGQQSPYDFTEEDIVRVVQWTAKNEFMILGEEMLLNMNVNELRNALKLSHNHPVVGSFSLTNENKETFQKYLKHEFDFSKYNYYLWGGK